MRPILVNHTASHNETYRFTITTTVVYSDDSEYPIESFDYITALYTLSGSFGAVSIVVNVLLLSATLYRVHKAANIGPRIFAANLIATDLFYSFFMAYSDLTFVSPLLQGLIAFNPESLYESNLV
ncbi:hypothetical protein AAVH_31689 [Aphelenchoides avenae]|nr:hypothetical protein AAVH_31689 [Aphelenchus avenae]